MSGKSVDVNKLIDGLEMVDMNHAEQTRVLLLAGLNDNLIKGQAELRKRLELIPNGWRQYRLAVATVDRLLTQIYATMTPKQLQSHAHAMANSVCGVKLKMASNSTEWVHVNEIDLDLVICIAMQHECRWCIRNDHEVRRCKLRRALSAIAAPDNVPKHGCGYCEMAMARDWQKDGEFNSD